MFAKVKISGVLETITGLHIGGSSAFSAIGAVDIPHRHPGCKDEYADDSG